MNRERNIREKLLRCGAMLIVLLLAMIAGGCMLISRRSSDKPHVTVYAALDREFSEPILNEYAGELALNVAAKYDVESTKTVGLTQAIIAEQDRPRCDLFWNNEILHTLRLKKLGLLRPFDLASAKGLPDDFRDRDRMWYGFAARARVILVNTKIVPRESFPQSVEDLAKPEWKGKAGIAKPLFGTTATHAAVLYAKLGPEAAEAMFRQWKENDVRILSGNKQTAQAVGRGELAWGLTDTDDAQTELLIGSPVAVIFPDQHAEGLGTLLIPNTICLIAGSPQSEPAERLAEMIVSEATERALAAGPSVQIPLLADSQAKSSIVPAETPRWMSIDFEQAAEHWERAHRFLSDTFSVP